MQERNHSNGIFTMARDWRCAGSAGSALELPPLGRCSVPRIRTATTPGARRSDLPLPANLLEQGSKPRRGTVSRPLTAESGYTRHGSPGPQNMAMRRISVRRAEPPDLCSASSRQDCDSHPRPPFTSPLPRASSASGPPPVSFPLPAPWLAHLEGGGAASASVAPHRPLRPR